MYRRKVLVGCLLSLTLPGCLGSPTASDDESSAPESALQEAYVLHLEPPESSITEEEDVCEFSELPEQAQREFERAIEDAEHRVEETPEILQRGCHNSYIEYDGKYYWLRITIES